jgi:AcrR family transcriptional regulator
MLEASLEVLAKEGASGLSLRKVAVAAGVTHAAPYHHFRDKTALVAAIAVEGFERLAEQMQAALTSARGEPLGGLLAIGQAYVQFAIAHPGHFAVMFRREYTRPDEHPDVLEAGASSFSLLVSAVAACRAAGYGASLETETLVLVVWSTVHGLAELWLNGPLAQLPELAGVGGKRLSAVEPALLSLLAATGPAPTHPNTPSEKP